MTRFKRFKIISILVFIFFYLINSEFAISKNETQYLLSNLEKSLNEKDIKNLENYFHEDEEILIKNKLSNILKEFEDLKWEISYQNSAEGQRNYLEVKLKGTKIVGEKEFILESSFDYYFSIFNGKIKDGIIRNDLTTIRNDNNLLDININIPDKVLSGSNYYLDIIINEPLGAEVYAGGIMPYQDNSLFGQNIVLEPLLAGGIFKVTRAPSQPGVQVWTGIIAHPKGLITFTKTVEITDQL